jgi:eukaryotic-like serine/threonine-protein kinase
MVPDPAQERPNGHDPRGGISRTEREACRLRRTRRGGISTVGRRRAYAPANMEAGSEVIAGRYRLVRRLGSGGMAVVVLAQDERLGREVALKRMHPDVGPDVARRFDREAKVGASLNHPNVVKVFDVVTEGEQVTIVMEYVQGRTLREILQEGPPEPPSALAILRPLADALDHAHEKGVIHRDVKPGNVLVRSDGTVKLADLGIATGIDTTRITTSGTQLGSVAYMAPEQIEGEEVTSATDVYALAAVAFETLSGRKARPASTPAAIVHQVANDPPPDLREAWPAAPAEATEVLQQGMAFHPAERPQSAGELLDLLERALGTEEHEIVRAAAAFTDTEVARPPEPLDEEVTPPTAAPEEAPRRREGPRRAIAFAVTALALAAVVAVGIALLTGNGEDGPATGDEQGERQGGGERSGAHSPTMAVRDFYELAAADRYGAAWRLAGPGLRRQMGGYDSFRGTFDSLRSVDFRKSEVSRRSGDRATVTVATTAVHSDRTERCRGDADLVGRDGRNWLIDRIHIACS